MKNERCESPQMKFAPNLPATPKSVSEGPSSTGGSADIECDSNTENGKNDDDLDTEYEDVDEQGKFILAPTPAQLGRAPLQRRLGNLSTSSDSNSQSHIKNDATSVVAQASVPSALPTPNSAAMDEPAQIKDQLSPSMLKKPLIKKAKGEDSNK